MDVPLLSRRDWLSTSGALLAASALGISSGSESTVAAEDMILNAQGGYRFLPGLPFLSFSARAADGFEIVRTTFRRARSFPEGITDIERLLQVSGRPIHALCGLELRAPRQFSPAEFGAFNQQYVARLEQAGLLLGGQVPVTRTNVASSTAQELSIHAFSSTVPVSGRAAASSPTFVFSAVPEVRNLRNAALQREPPDFVAAGDTTPTGVTTLAGLRLKTEFILTAIDEAMRTSGVTWTDVTSVQLYTVHDVQPLLADLILPRVGAAGRFGIEWYHTLPPSALNILEIGVRGTHMESVA